MKNRSYQLVLCALFAALLGLFSQIVIPVGPIPISFATLAVYCAAGLLGGRNGAIAVLLWLGLGAVGVPVFAMFRGGLPTLAGATGGFAIGYVPSAFIAGKWIEKIRMQGRIKNKKWFISFALATGQLVCFSLGTIWYMELTHSTLWQALLICVLPFLPGEVVKIFLATVLIERLEPVMKKEKGFSRQ